MTRHIPFALSAIVAATLAFGAHETIAPMSVAAATPPCEQTPPTVPTSPTTPPAPPTNLRVIGGGGSDSLESDTHEEGSGPFVPEGGSAAAMATGSHAYYEALASRSDCLRAWSLRSQAQLNSLVADDVATFFSYNPGGDTYPDAQDAAKLVVANKAGASIPTRQQLRMDLPLVDSGTLLLTWDWYWGPEFLTKRGLMNHYKLFKFQIQGSHAWWTMMQSPAWADVPPTSSDSVAKLWDSGPWSGGQPNGAQRREPWTPAGQGAPDQQKDSGTQVNVHHSRWMRYWVEIKLFQPHTTFTEWNAVSGATLQPHPSDMQGRWHMVSVWYADEQRAPMRILYRVPFGWSDAWTGLVSRFDFEMNTSQNEGFIGPWTGYGRNVVVLRNYKLPTVPEQDTLIFQRPIR